MSSSGSPSSGANLSELLEKLCESGIDFILVGGLAAVIQGSPITTMDVDIVHRRTLDNIDRLMIFLKSIGTFYRRPDEKTIEPVPSDLAGMGHMLFTTRLGPLDVLSHVEGKLTYEDLVGHTVEIPFRGYKIRVLDLKTLVDLKRLSKNPKDQQRLAILEETLRLSSQ